MSKKTNKNTTVVEEQANVTVVENNAAEQNAPATTESATESATEPATEEAPATPAAPAQPAKKAKLTDNELEALYQEHLAKKNHVCQAVPFGEWEWLDGYIHNVEKDMRARKVFYVIKLNDGRIIRKVYNNKGLRIGQAVVENVPTKRTRSANSREKELWTPEKWDETIRAYAPAVGSWIDVDGQYGRIISLVPDKRVNMLLLRIKVVDETGAEKIKHLSFNQLDWTKLTSDDDTAKLHDEWLARYEARLAKEPKEKVDKLAKAKEQLEKAKARVAELESLVLKLEAAESQAVLQTKETEEPVAEAPTAEAPVEEPATADDLM